ncbi:hypothetical protein NDU88_002355 [Pleurodeles waltl]|uniref:Uncharacterized protein n=1 Tax=Pleurodeles waltl TaxID=8319 RepID=A0AAV7TKC8_PLEWA|nr:hypothetical protein NDU88_002355 [Pleurodeles waltl]
MYYSLDSPDHRESRLRCRDAVPVRVGAHAAASGSLHKGNAEVGLRWTGALLTPQARGGVGDRRGAGAGEEPTPSESPERPVPGESAKLGPCSGVCDCGIPLLALRTGFLERGHGLQRLSRSCCCAGASLRRMQAGPTRPPLLQ